MKMCSQCLSKRGSSGKYLSKVNHYPGILNKSFLQNQYAAMSCWHIKCENEFQWGKSAIKNRFYSDMSEGNRCSIRINVKKGKRSRNCCSAQYHFLSQKSNDLKQHLAVCDTVAYWIDQPKLTGFNKTQSRSQSLKETKKKNDFDYVIKHLFTTYRLYMYRSIHRDFFPWPYRYQQRKTFPEHYFCLVCILSNYQRKYLLVFHFFYIFILKKHKLLRPLVFH